MFEDRDSAFQVLHACGKPRYDVEIVGNLHNLHPL
jgi:hypothetical protein